MRRIVAVLRDLGGSVGNASVPDGGMSSAGKDASVVREHGLGC